MIGNKQNKKRKEIVNKDKDYQKIQQQLKGNLKILKEDYSDKRKKNKEKRTNSDSLLKSQKEIQKD